MVLGGELRAQRDIVCITISSPWMLANALRAIIAGWGWQLNGDVTGKLCRASVDLLQFGINSIPHRNHVFCLAVIPKATESEAVYPITWDDSRAAVLLLLTLKDCCVAGCACCGPILELIRHPQVQAFMRSAWFRNAELPVETAMCDNFKGWGKF